MLYPLYFLSTGISQVQLGFSECPVMWLTFGYCLVFLTRGATKMKSKQRTEIGPRTKKTKRSFYVFNTIFTGTIAFSSKTRLSGWSY